MSSIITQTYKTPVGELILGSYQQQLCLCDWRYRKMREQIDKRIQSGLSAFYKEGCDEVLETAKSQFEEYFNGKRREFDVPLLLVGTEFQRQVWNALAKVSYGETCSYSDLATAMNAPNSVRAVAAANGANAISIIIPCHRIIGSNGDLTGYAGGVSAKQKLLNLERKDLFSQ